MKDLNSLVGARSWRSYRIEVLRSRLETRCRGFQIVVRDQWGRRRNRRSGGWLDRSGGGFRRGLNLLVLNLVRVLDRRHVFPRQFQHHTDHNCCCHCRRRQPYPGLEEETPSADDRELYRRFRSYFRFGQAQHHDFPALAAVRQMAENPITLIRADKAFSITINHIATAAETDP